MGGFTFDAGEAAFADDAFLVSGSGVRFNCLAGGTAASSIAEALSGSDITQCVNVSGGGDGIVEVQFTDNSIVNGPGTDLVIFEVSGPKTPGTADPAERFEVSVFDGATFSPFTSFDPVATGFTTPEPTLDLFAVEIDLSLFGIAAGATVDRVRLHLFDNNLGSKGADITALGAINSLALLPTPTPTPTASPTATPTATPTPTPTPVVQSKEQQKCIKLMNRASVNVGKAQGSESSKCVRYAAMDATDKLGIPPQAQTAQECLTNDVKGKVQKKFGKLAKRDASKCRAEPQQLPDFGYVGALGAGAAILSESFGLTAELFGPDLDAVLVLKDQDEEGAKCQDIAHRWTYKVFDAVTKEVERGVNYSLRGKATPQADSGAILSSAARDFIDDDAKDKIARAEQKVADKIGRACQGDLASLFPGACSGRAGTASDLAQCLNEAARCRGCKAAEGFGALTLDCEDFDNGLADSSCP